MVIVLIANAPLLACLVYVGSAVYKLAVVVGATAYASPFIRAIGGAVPVVPPVNVPTKNSAFRRPAAVASQPTVNSITRNGPPEEAVATSTDLAVPAVSATAGLSMM